MVSRNHLQETLDYYLQQRAYKMDEIKAIDLMVRQLQKELGESPSADSSSMAQDGNNLLLSTTSSEVAQRSIRPDEFFGMSQTDAAKSYLRTIKRAISMEQLVTALKEGGAQLGGANPKKTLYVSLARNPLKEFVSPKEGFVGLREFYKTLPKQTGKSPSQKRETTSSKKARNRRAAKQTAKQTGSPATLKVKMRVRQFLSGKDGQRIDEITKDAESHLGQPIKRSLIWGILRSKDFSEEDGKYKMTK
jgi:hypothetical protein